MASTPVKRLSGDAIGGSRQRIKARADTPFPLKQLLILSIARFAEPIAFMSIFPYIYYMIASFHITSDDRQISIYAGLVTSSFAIAECSCSAMWGRLSDRIGRKPVLLVGLGGTGISMLTFGFARSLPVALAARFVGGLLNGNGGVLQTMVAEIVTVKEHQPRAYTFLPLTWGLGSVVGSFLGGTLADPVRNYPEMFPKGSWPLLERYPFLLPNLFASGMVIFGMVVAVFFFHETHPTKRFERDRGVEFARWIGRTMTGRSAKPGVRLGRHKAKRSDVTGSVDLTERDEEEAEGLLKDEIELTDSPGAASLSTVSSPRTLVDEKQSSPAKGVVGFDAAAPKLSSNSIRAAFTPQVTLTIIAYGLLAFHTIELDQLLPVFLSLPPSPSPSDTALHFTGGLGMTPISIGWVFSLQAIYSMFFQLLAAPPLIRHYGYLSTFRFTAFTWPLLYLFTPYLSRLPSNSWAQWAALACMCLWKTSWGCLAYLTILIMISNTVKEAGMEHMMGVVNGVSASFASGARAVGPTLAGWLFNVGEEWGVSVFVWWFTAAVALGGAVESFWMKEGVVEDFENGDDDAGSVTVVGDEEDGDEDGAVFSEDEGVELHSITRKHKEKVLQEEVMLKGEVEEQTEGGIGGAPVGFGSTVVAVTGQLTESRSVKTD